jgi:hypothetical protein
MFPFLHLLYLASPDNLNSFSSKHLLMTSSQKTKENEKIDQGPGPCCDDSWVLTLTVPLAGSSSPGLIEMSTSSVRFPLGASLSSWALVPIELTKSNLAQSLRPEPRTFLA